MLNSPCCKHEESFSVVADVATTGDSASLLEGLLPSADDLCCLLLPPSPPWDDGDEDEEEAQIDADEDVLMDLEEVIRSNMVEVSTSPLSGILFKEEMEDGEKMSLKPLMVTTEHHDSPMSAVSPSALSTVDYESPPATPPKPCNGVHHCGICKLVGIRIKVQNICLTL